MSHQFKAGDLALIKRDKSDYNLMKQVELIEFVNPGETYNIPGLDKNIRNVAKSSVWVVSGDVVSQDIGVTGFCQKAERNLMPLRGDFQPEREREEELAQ